MQSVIEEEVEKHRSHRTENQLGRTFLGLIEIRSIQYFFCSGNTINSNAHSLQVRSGNVCATRAY